jgi:hypothetical protein
MPRFWPFRLDILGGLPGTGFAPKTDDIKKINEATKNRSFVVRELGAK